MVFMTIAVFSCTPELKVRELSNNLPDQYKDETDTTNSSRMNWREYFTDPNLIALIDTALANNQELNITLQEIEISRNEVMARKGE